MLTKYNPIFRGTYNPLRYFKDLGASHSAPLKKAAKRINWPTVNEAYEAANAAVNLSAGNYIGAAYHAARAYQHWKSPYRKKKFYRNQRLRIYPSRRYRYRSAYRRANRYTYKRHYYRRNKRYFRNKKGRKRYRIRYIT